MIQNIWRKVKLKASREGDLYFIKEEVELIGKVMKDVSY